MEKNGNRLLDKLDLGKEKIGKLLLTFSIPCIISMVVNALYNIVDQIFIGWGVGYLGNGATNIIFPITVITLAFSLMFGDGASAFLSLKLGEGKKEEASKGVGNSIIANAFVSIILSILVLAFLPMLVKIFGGTDVLMKYALDYGYVIAIGIPFMMVGTALNGVIRADGAPKYAMASMLVGAILNIVLDPIMIFALHLGVKGAAIATVISQIVTFFMNVIYVKNFKSIKITKESLKPDFKYILKVIKLGISSVITQISIVIVIAVQNNLIAKYGKLSEFGAEIPLTVIGIVMKINQILSSVIIGIAVGSQPIVGFNYGARKYDRVKETLRLVLIISFVVSTIAFILFQTIPEKLIGLFGSGDELYNKFACLTFRIFLMLIICDGIQIASGIFFQAIGKSSKAAFLTLSRQILFFIPSAIILTKLYGINGVLYVGPVADALAFIVSVILLVKEYKNLSYNDEVTENIEESNNYDINIDKKQRKIITINREYGSGGRYVGKLLAEKLNINLYDKKLITLVADSSGLAASYITENEQTLEENLLSNYNSSYYNNLTNDETLFIAESNAIKEIANDGPCVIIGRCADYVLKDKDNVLKVFLYSDDKSKVKRAVKYYGLDEKSALKKINKINKERSKHYTFFTNNEWKDPANYDICINVDKIGIKETVDMIANLV